MGLLEWSAKLERKINFPWQLVGLFIALVFGGLTIYTEFLRDQSPHLQIEVLSNEPVLDVREKLPDLEVLYQGQDIAKSGKTLSVLLVRIANRGSANLLSAFYDINSPVRLGLSHGALVKADITEASNPYLREAATLTRVGPDVAMNPVIIEKNEWFTVKLLVLHDVELRPEVHVSGKVAGQHTISAISTDPDDSKPGFWQSVVAGGLWVQIARVPVYLFGCAAVLVATGVPASIISDALSRRRRRRLVEKFKNRTKLNTEPADDFIFDNFVTYGTRFMREFVSELNDNELVHRRVERLVSGKKVRKVPSSDIGDISVTTPFLFRRSDWLKEMFDLGYFLKDVDTWVVAPDRKAVAAAFAEYLDLVRS
ncbi:hypothetical protein ABVB70_25975 [Agrobacterium radiobacter]|uniref:DUF4350 domain-containing protein n=1 Tax=Agrobacterium radiobacter TaxID=362 RepID=A0ABD5LSJ0_AGRRD